MEATVVVLFVAALLSIMFADNLAIEKYKSSLFFGALAWVLLWIDGAGESELVGRIKHDFEDHILEIALLWLFLISAMTFVAYLEKRGWFDKMVLKWLPERISERKLLLVMGGLTFFFSPLADNLTTTLVALTVTLALLKDAENWVKELFAVFIVFVANVGGLPLITGDVTTLMIFVSGVISMKTLLWLYIPGLVTFVILYLYMAPKLKGTVELKKGDLKINSIDHQIAIMFFITIAAIPITHIMWDLPPVLVFLLGLSAMFLLIAHEGKRTQQEMRALDYIRRIELDVLFFFLGILLLVGALKEVGTLELLSGIYNYMPESVATYLIGIISAGIDNIPVTSALLKAGLPLDEHGWMLMTYAVGAGGSLTSFGSVAGIVAMGKVKTLNFWKYGKYFPILFVSYTVGFVVTYYLPGWWSVWFWSPRKWALF